MNDKLRRLIRAVIILIGIGILVYPSLSEYLQQKNASRVIASYDDTVNRTEQARLDALLEEAREYNRMLASSTGFKKPPVDADGNPISLDSYGQMLNINGDGMMGYITIPKINVTCRILHGTEESVLQVAAGHQQNTSLPVGGETTHAVLSGHRGLPTAALFTDLDRLEVGDVFYIKVLDRTLCYTVDQIVTVLPDETEELAIKEGMDYVTLVTCTPYGINSHRLFVRGVRTAFDDSQGIPVYSDSDLRSFWQRLPMQYRHMLLGAGVIVAFLIVWYTTRGVIRVVMKKKAKAKDQEIKQEQEQAPELKQEENQEKEQDQKETEEEEGVT